MDEQKHPVQEEIERYEGYATALAPFRDVPNITHCSMWRGSKDYITFHAVPGTARDVVRAVSRLLRVPQADKSFSEHDGTVRYRVASAVYDITVVESSPICELREIEEVVEIPAAPAHTETRKRFVIANPEQCLGPGYDEHGRKKEEA